MYSVSSVKAPVPGGLGIPLWLGGLIATVGGTVASVVATRVLSRPSGSEQKRIEEQIRKQQEMEIQRMIIEQQGTQQTMSYALPLLGGLALLMFMR